ncbi:hypothetical protein TNCV_4424611 [Trichonephila clavipes]|nr:hypothetical protein TNCV_4424611 [Trichonephila clavipes]
MKYSIKTTRKSIREVDVCVTELLLKSDKPHRNKFRALDSNLEVKRQVHKSEANPQVYVETPLHPEKLTVWCALWAGGILLQKRWPQRYSQW